jgi:hypothetical protein
MENQERSFRLRAVRPLDSILPYSFFRRILALMNARTKTRNQFIAVIFLGIFLRCHRISAVGEIFPMGI